MSHPIPWMEYEENMEGWCKRCWRICGRDHAKEDGRLPSNLQDSPNWNGNSDDVLYRMRGRTSRG